MRWRVLPSPVGPLLLGAQGPHLRRIAFTDEEPTGLAGPDAGSLEEAVLAETAHQLGEYFAGERERFELPLAPRGTDVQRRVWWALADLGYGTTVSYGTLAARVGGSPRSVGAALGANPIVIVLPCHRVVGADGGLVGFGGGVARKETLLALEGSALL
ncbi:methylated-DNA--[protein]-cysteine S-methyltransferase [Actinotalea lenta]|uniref:methylated-DNA--[protein]-cysteine S-methyltransferase n=1 Tax=Actinotalea lenta TaxID=3064654 RepID=UPI00272A57DC|nr:methylated-DNA--[protein]-cysteine S-methyltransferase [Isoptericola sp. b490]